MKKQFLKIVLVSFAALFMLQSCKEEEPEVQCKDCDCTSVTERVENWVNVNDSNDTKTVSPPDESNRFKSTFCSGMYENTNYQQTLEYWESNPSMYSQDTYTEFEDGEEYEVDWTEETTYNCSCN